MGDRRDEAHAPPAASAAREGTWDRSIHSTAARTVRFCQAPDVGPVTSAAVFVSVRAQTVASSPAIASSEPGTMR